MTAKSFITKKTLTMISQIYYSKTQMYNQSINLT